MADESTFEPTASGTSNAAWWTRGEILTGLVVLGLGLRLWAYLPDTSLILDEILLSRNIREAPWVQLLTQPLDHAQVAPRGFLAVERFFVLVFGAGEHALRLFPLLCALASVELFRRLAVRVLVPAAATVAVALFAVAVPFIKYAAEVKQYGVDVLVAIVLMSIAQAIRTRDVPTSRLVLAGLAGFVVSLFSQASVLVMGGIGAGLLFDWWRSRDRLAWRALVTVVPLWAVASILALVIGVRSMAPATRDYMYDYWRRGFLPWPPAPVADGRWLLDSLKGFFTDVRLLNYPLPWMFVVIALAGGVSLWRRSRAAALILLSPLAVTFLAAGAHQYPFRSRLILFLVPSVLLAIAAGAEWLASLAGRTHRALRAVVLAVVVLPPAGLMVIAHPPYEIEDYRHILAYLQQQRKPGDVIYVLPPLREGFLYYGPQYGVQAGDITVAACHREQTRPYLEDVDAFRGTRRFWFASWSGGTYGAARTTLRRYLVAIGDKRESLTLRTLGRASTDVELYDLGDSTKLAAASADRFPAPPMPTDTPRPWCGRGARSDPLGAAGGGLD